MMNERKTPNANARFRINLAIAAVFAAFSIAPGLVSGSAQATAGDQFPEETNNHTCSQAKVPHRVLFGVTTLDRVSMGAPDWWQTQRDGPTLIGVEPLNGLIRLTVYVGGCGGSIGCREFANAAAAEVAKCHALQEDRVEVAYWGGWDSESTRYWMRVGNL